MVTLKRAQELFRYHPETGEFTRACDLPNGFKAGSVAGSLSSKGYRVLSIDGHPYSAHRIAWLLVYGEMPTGHIDHANGDRTDNRLRNLRPASTRENGQNRAEHRGGRLVGADFHKASGKWRSRMQVQGKSQVLGYFDTEVEAHTAYRCAELAHELRQTFVEVGL